MVASNGFERIADQHVRWAIEMQRYPELDVASSPYASLNKPRWVDADGDPTLERQLFHTQLISDLIDSVPDVGQEKRAVVLAGRPGAGKSYALNVPECVENIPARSHDSRERGSQLFCKLSKHSKL